MIKSCVKCRKQFSTEFNNVVICAECTAYVKGYKDAEKEFLPQILASKDSDKQLDKLGEVLETVWEIPRCEGDGNPVTNAINLLHRLRKLIPNKTKVIDEKGD